MRTQLSDVAIFFIVLRKVSVKDRKNQWFDTFDSNENIKATRENIDCAVYEMEQDEFLHDLVYKEMYLLQEKVEFDKSRYATSVNTDIKKKLIWQLTQH